MWQIVQSDFKCDEHQQHQLSEELLFEHLESKHHVALMRALNDLASEGIPPTKFISILRRIRRLNTTFSLAKEDLLQDLNWAKDPLRSCTSWVKLKTHLRGKMAEERRKRA